MIHDILYLGTNKESRNNGIGHPLSVDIVELQFKEYDGVTDTVWHNTQFNITHRFHKYKTVELKYNGAIERVFLSIDKINLNTFTSELTNQPVQIFPLYSKVIYPTFANIESSDINRRMYAFTYQIQRVAAIMGMQLSLANEKHLFLNELKRLGFSDEMLSYSIDHHNWLKHSINAIMALNYNYVRDSRRYISYVVDFIKHLISEDNGECYNEIDDCIVNFLEPDLHIKDSLSPAMSMNKSYMSTDLLPYVANQYWTSIHRMQDEVFKQSWRLFEHENSYSQYRKFVTNHTGIAANVLYEIIKYVSLTPYTDICVVYTVEYDDIHVAYCNCRYRTPEENLKYKLDIEFLKYKLSEYAENILIDIDSVLSERVEIRKVVLFKSWSEELIIHVYTNHYTSVTSYVDLTFFNLGMCMHKMREYGSILREQR